MSERRLIQCDNCEQTLELPVWEVDEDSADAIADHGWLVLVHSPAEQLGEDEQDEPSSDSHYCSIRCLAVWSTAAAVTLEEIDVRAAP